MSKKLTVSEINSRLKERGIIVIGEYKSNNTPVAVQCENGHTWNPTVANLLFRQDGCPHCSRHSSVFQWNKELINQHLHSRKIELISEYPGKANRRGTFMCAEGHIWTTTISSVLNGKGCINCYGKTMPLSLEIIQQRYHSLGYTVSGAFTGHGCKLTFTCPNNHTWIGNSANTRCSSCADYGFNLERPSFGYILKFANFIKYGISNSIASRLSKHRSHNPPHSVVAVFKFCTGTEAKSWEKSIKSEFGGKFVDKFQCPDGWTETLSLKMLDAVIEKCSDVSLHTL